MGDKYRFLALTEVVNRYYYPPLKIADVAGGNGILNDILTRSGFEVETIDPNLRFKNLNLNGRRTEFNSSMAEEFDLIIGLHPDEATEEIVYSAKYKPIIVVPCCKFWTGKEMKSTHNIRGTIEKYFRENDIPFLRGELEISGPNVFYITSN